ncbi:hypothetical protein LOAG_07734 [Loa loa]|uniref:Uncharacterized protein n=1 Tax=Loa loa TaxID=7209 RepID=A0A1S0TVN6_LOALO|nr:hypothetical protein LOAG_07734 [Loa loa]EFO20753.1 hypothetical protein LOAG_07734 [Loa loa]
MSSCEVNNLSQNIKNDLVCYLATYKRDEMMHLKILFHSIVNELSMDDLFQTGMKILSVKLRSALADSVEGKEVSVLPYSNSCFQKTKNKQEGYVGDIGQGSTI